jgi:hypothetical protein
MMTYYIRTTALSPAAAEQDDDVHIIGPFATEQEVVAFLDKYGRTFSSRITVWSPTEYAALVEEESAG